MSAWLEILRQRREEDGGGFLVTVLGVRGSAPREIGARMFVTALDVAGSIGGGQLEYQCTKIACGELGAGAAARRAFVRRFPLGSHCGQCCGGVVEVLFESVAAVTPAWIEALLACFDARVPAVMVTAMSSDGRHGKMLVTAETVREFAAPFAIPAAVVGAARQAIASGATAARLYPDRRGKHALTILLEPVMSSNFNLALFGAGHVGSAVVAAMAGFDCNLRWVDSRRRVFPDTVPANTTRIESEGPQREVAAMPAGAFYLVMTHSHPLDYEICEAVLRRGDFAYLGLIGSLSKRRRFERRMRKQGFPSGALERLTCPIGIQGIPGKRPEEIAIAVAAELLQRKEALARPSAESGPRPANLHVLMPRA